VDFNDELGQLPPDLNLGTTADQLMRRGRRIRHIRQSSVAGAAALAVFGIAATGFAFTGRDNARVVHPASGGLGLTLTSPSPSASASLDLLALPNASAVASMASPAASSASPKAPASPPVGTSSTISTASCTPAPQSDVGAPAANTSGNGPAWGTPIPAGTDSGKSVVLYGIHISDSAIPCTHFGVMLGTTDGSGATSAVTGEYAANEFDGSDLAPGMHAVGLSGGGNQIKAWYLIGYYVGDAASVSVDEKALASPVAATVVPWSVNPNVKFWWLCGTGAVPTFGTLHAADASGAALPIGAHAQIGVG
jgi:hypothetical protein